MDKRDFRTIVKRLDNEKYDLYFDKDIAFNLTALDVKTGEVNHVGLANIGQMIRMVFINLIDVYKNFQDESSTIEDFSEVFMKDFIEFYKEHGNLLAVDKEEEPQDEWCAGNEDV